MTADDQELMRAPREAPFQGLEADNDKEHQEADTLKPEDLDGWLQPRQKKQTHPRKYQDYFVFE